MDKCNATHHTYIPTCVFVDTMGGTCFLEDGVAGLGVLGVRVVVEVGGWQQQRGGGGQRVVPASLSSLALSGHTLRLAHHHEPARREEIDRWVSRCSHLYTHRHRHEGKSMFGCGWRVEKSEDIIFLPWVRVHHTHILSFQCTWGLRHAAILDSLCRTAVGGSRLIITMNISYVMEQLVAGRKLLLAVAANNRCGHFCLQRCHI